MNLNTYQAEITRDYDIEEYNNILERAELHACGVSIVAAVSDNINNDESIELEPDYGRLIDHHNKIQYLSELVRDTKPTLGTWKLTRGEGKYVLRWELLCDDWPQIKTGDEPLKDYGINDILHKADLYHDDLDGDVNCRENDQGVWVVYYDVHLPDPPSRDHQAATIR